jgi:WD40 repeat protein
MHKPAAPLQSLVDLVQPHTFAEHVLHVGFLGQIPFFVLTDGAIVLGEDQRALHPHGANGILCALSDDTRLVTGGEDGKVIETRSDGTMSVLADEKGRWIETLALGPDGAVAYAVGKKVVARAGKGKEDKGKTREWQAPSTPQGLAFAPKGYRLAIAHIDGASCWFPATDAPPEKFEWKGPHLDVTFSPDNRFLVTSMVENQLHGWTLAEKRHMRMSGYPAKTRSFSWSGDGLWLATSGAEAAITWPFAKDGPTGKAPREAGVRPAKVTQVAFHPKALVLAIGYEDGFVMLVRFTDNAEILVRAPGENKSAISALAWDRGGKHLIFGLENGEAGRLALPMP